MMRLPLFEFRAPQTVEEAARILDGEGPKAMPLAGGTDLLPNMKRRQQVPKTLMSLNRIPELHQTKLGESGSDRKSTRLNSSHRTISYAVFCLKKKKKIKSTILHE